LVHSLHHNNKAAQELIDKGLVEIDGEKILNNCMVSDGAEIRVKGLIERPKKEFVYLKFYKPVGFESTLNNSIANNLSPFFSGHSDLAIAGRLDKQSEGLLLLSNDGKWIERLCNPKFEKEKEYLVTLDRKPNESFTVAFEKGIQLGRYLTAPCICVHLEASLIKVILKEGKNRQIRRMCKALDYTVLKLKRTRIDEIYLENLDSGEKRRLS